VAVGCRAEYRISLDEFLAMQAAEHAAVIERPDTQPTEVIDERLGPYKVGPGDVLTVTITNTQNTFIAPIPARVDREGFIDLPIVGEIQVGGLELDAVEEMIKNAYVPRVFGDASAHAALTEIDGTSVLVMGAVTSPGLIPLRRTERNVLFAIVSAGGVTQDSAGKATLRRLRQPTETTSIDLTDPVQLKEALAMAPLEDGDIITVHSRMPNTLFVGGLVQRASAQMYPLGASVTVLQALAGAQGLRTDVTPNEGTLIRRMADGRDVMVKLELDRIARGEAPNIELMAGDILWVPQTFTTRVQDWANRNLFLRAGISVVYSVTGIEFMNRQDQQSAALGGGGDLQDSFDPLGFLNRNAALQTLTSRPGP
jgi:polysaccharide export outer membrane protein